MIYVCAFDLQLRQGNVFNIESGKQALRNINSLALFSNIEVNPRPDEKNEGGIIVEIKLKELDQKSAEVSTEWSIVPGRGGRPTLVCKSSYIFVLCNSACLVIRDCGLNFKILIYIVCILCYVFCSGFISTWWNCLFWASKSQWA